MRWATCATRPMVAGASGCEADALREHPVHAGYQKEAEGADGQETAKRLIRVVQRGDDSRSKLDTLLAGRKAKLSASDIGAPALDEDA